MGAGDGIWRWFAAAGDGLAECGSPWNVAKQGGPVYAYLVPIIPPFVDGFLFQRAEQNGGEVVYCDRRAR